MSALTENSTQSNAVTVQNQDVVPQTAQNQDDVPQTVQNQDDVPQTNNANVENQLINALANTHIEEQTPILQIPSLAEQQIVRRHYDAWDRIENFQNHYRKVINFDLKQNEIRHNNLSQSYSQCLRWCESLDGIANFNMDTTQHALIKSLYYAWNRDYSFEHYYKKVIDIRLNEENRTTENPNGTIVRTLFSFTGVKKFCQKNIDGFNIHIDDSAEHRLVRSLYEEWDRYVYPKFKMYNRLVIDIRLTAVHEQGNIVRTLNNRDAIYNYLAFYYGKEFNGSGHLTPTQSGKWFNRFKEIACGNWTGRYGVESLNNTQGLTIEHSQIEINNNIMNSTQRGRIRNACAVLQFMWKTDNARMDSIERPYFYHLCNPNGQTQRGYNRNANRRPGSNIAIYEKTLNSWVYIQNDSKPYDVRKWREYNEFKKTGWDVPRVTQAGYDEIMRNWRENPQAQAIIPQETTTPVATSRNKFFNALI